MILDDKSFNEIISSILSIKDLTEDQFSTLKSATISRAANKGFDKKEIDLQTMVENWGILKPVVNEKKLFIAQLVLDNFHLFEHDVRNIIGDQYWKQYRERVESLVELDKKVNS